MTTENPSIPQPIAPAAQQDPSADAAERRQLVIIGSGPAGFTAALYASRANMDVLLLRGAEPGGQLTLTPDIENYPGFPDGLSGIDLMTKMEEQAGRFGAELRYGQVTDLDLTQRPYRMTVDGRREVVAESIILSTGASARYLGLENERRLLGRGVSACATCDGAFFRDLEVAVVGGGDTAMEEALFLTRFATRVYVIHRRDQFRASRIMQDRVLAHPKIEVLWNRQVGDVLGEERVEGLELIDTESGGASTLEVGGVFIAIGHQPNTGLVEGALELDEHGYLVTEPGSTRTSLPGVFASGDVQDSIYRQAITAAGTGAMAALDAERWLAEQPQDASPDRASALAA
ncbi:MAG: thioredoxin-disulfide reductase [Acidobacteriota bacterium]